MANPHKGEVAFAAGGESYKLRFSIDALCALEEATNLGVVELSEKLSDFKKIRLGLVRHVVWAGLREAHPDVDLKAAGEIIASAGGISAMIPHISRAFALAFPEPEKGEVGDAARPPKPGRAGPGSAS